MGLLVRFLLQSFSPSLEVVLYKKIDCQSKRCPLNFLCSKNFQGWLLKIFNGWFFFSRFQILQNLHARLQGEFLLTNSSWDTFRFTGVLSRFFHGSELKLSPKKKRWNYVRHWFVWSLGSPSRELWLFHWHYIRNVKWTEDFWDSS